MNKNNCVVIVSSCDAYEDAWAPFFTLFFRYWPDCPFPVYLVSDTKIYNDYRVTTLNVGYCEFWSDRTKRALEMISQKYLINFHEDFLIRERVDNQKILNLLDYVRNHDTTCLRLNPVAKPDLPYDNKLNLGEISPKAVYRVSLHSSIWNRQSLLGLLVRGETAQEMEMNGTIRSRKMDKLFLSVQDPAINYFETAIIRGKWTYDGVRLCKKNGIKIDLTKRPIDYSLKLRTVLDGWRKLNWARKLREFPILGSVFAKVFGKISRSL